MGENITGASVEAYMIMNELREFANKIEQVIDENRFAREDDENVVFFIGKKEGDDKFAGLMMGRSDNMIEIISKSMAQNEHLFAAIMGGIIRYIADVQSKRVEITPESPKFTWHDIINAVVEGASDESDKKFSYLLALHDDDCGPELCFSSFVNTAFIQRLLDGPIKRHIEKSGKYSFDYYITKKT